MRAGLEPTYEFMTVAREFLTQQADAVRNNLINFRVQLKSGGRLELRGARLLGEICAFCLILSLYFLSFSLYLLLNNRSAVY